MTQLDKAKELAYDFLYLPMEETRFSPVVVMHPFLESALLQDSKGAFNALEEEDRYNDYLHHFYERLKKCEDIESILNFVRKSYKLTFLKFLRANQIISMKECGNLLAEIWSLIEVITHDVNVSKEQVLRWIKSADKNILMDAEEQKIFNNMEGEIIVYRGCRDKRGAKGISWTLDEDIARWFANRWGNKGCCFKAKIKKEYVIGYVNNRSEKEIILDYHFIEDICLI